jgi:hypothetical protein
VANVVDLVLVQEAPTSPGTHSLLSGSIYGVDLGSAGKYNRLIGEEPPQTSFEPSIIVPEVQVVPVSTWAHSLLSGSIYGVDHSGAGIYRIPLYGIDHTRGYSAWVRIDGAGARTWSLLDDTVLASFRVDGAGVRRWTMEETRTGELLIRGTSERLWSGTELTAPEAFRINGTAERLWSLPTGRFRIAGTSTRRWTAAIGIADECLTADGESEPSSGYGTGLYGDELYGDSPSGEGGGQVKNYVF